MTGDREQGTGDRDACHALGPQRKRFHCSVAGRSMTPHVAVASGPVSPSQIPQRISSPLDGDNLPHIVTG